MRSKIALGFVALWLGVAALPVAATAQSEGTETMSHLDTSEPPIYEYNLSGPRIGATFSPTWTRSQFGWHFEHQASPGTKGPWFIVETVLLAGGLERSEFIPTGTLIFGIRLPNSLEFGVGPSATVAPGFVHSGIVVAVGQSMRFGAIRVPVNLAVALDKDGEHRVSLVTGWAIRDRAIVR